MRSTTGVGLPGAAELSERGLRVGLAWLGSCGTLQGLGSSAGREQTDLFGLRVEITRLVGPSSSGAAPSNPRGFYHGWSHCPEHASEVSWLWRKGAGVPETWVFLDGAGSVAAPTEVCTAVRGRCRIRVQAQVYCTIQRRGVAAR